LAIETIKVGQGDGPTLKFRLQERLPDGTRVPYDLSGGATVHFIGKATRDTPDGSAEFDYTGTIIADGSASGATYSQVNIAVSPSDTASPVVLFAKLVATKGGSADTVKQVWFEVSDT
jgi:hypothetical protein